MRILIGSGSVLGRSALFVLIAASIALFVSAALNDGYAPWVTVTSKMDPVSLWFVALGSIVVPPMVAVLLAIPVVWIGSVTQRVKRG